MRRNKDETALPEFQARLFGLYAFSFSIAASVNTFSFSERNPQRILGRLVKL